MSVRILSLAILVCVGALVLGCAAKGLGQVAPSQTKDARIVTYIDKDGKCKTKTTPYVPDIKRSRRDKVRWRIVDDYHCTARADVTVEIRFDKKGASPFESPCDLIDDRKIECRVAPTGSDDDVEYSVWMGGLQEDPVLQIEM